MAKGVQLHEPDVPRYHVTLTQPRGGGKTQIMMIERLDIHPQFRRKAKTRLDSYATEDALKFHKTTEHYFKMMDALEKEGLVDGDMIHEIADVAMGFTR